MVEDLMPVNSVTIRKSPIVMVKTFLLLETASMLFFFGSGYFIYYAKWYRSLSLGHYLSFSLAEALGILLFQTIAILYSFFRWRRQFIKIKPDAIIYEQGFFVRRRNAIPFSSFGSASWSQSLFGKIGNYGSLILRNGDNGSNIWKFSDVPDPRRQADIILKFKHAHSPSPALSLEEILSLPENEKLEFKSTLRWDLKWGKINKMLERSAMKTIAAFLNSQGGYLVLGIDDRRQAVGLDYDFASLGKPNPDGFEVHFSHLFHTMIGSQFRHHIRLTWHTIADKTCCLVSVSPSPTPAYLKQEEREEFFIRTGNGTTSLQFSEAAAYIDRRFKATLI